MSSKIAEIKRTFHGSRMNLTSQPSLVSNSYLLRSVSKSDIPSKKPIYFGRRGTGKNKSGTFPVDLGGTVNVQARNEERGEIPSGHSAWHDPPTSRHNDSTKENVSSQRMRSPRAKRTETNLTNGYGSSQSREPLRENSISLSSERCLSPQPKDRLHPSFSKNRSPPRKDLSVSKFSRISSPERSRPKLNASINLSERYDISHMQPRVVLEKVRAVPQSQIHIRDNDGFLVPNMPAVKEIPSKNLEVAGKHAIRLIGEYIDTISHLVGFYYEKQILQKGTEILRNIERKKMTNNECPRSDEKKSEILSWLQSSIVDRPIATRLDREGSVARFPNAPSIISGQTVCQLRNVRDDESREKSIFLMKGWTLIKGMGLGDVLVAGNIYDLASGFQIEENHVSHKIVSAQSKLVQTAQSVYYLNGGFKDPYNVIPPEVKKHFQDGVFPSHWVQVIKMWGLLHSRGGKPCAPVPLNNFSDNMSLVQSPRHIQPPVDSVRMGSRNHDELSECAEDEEVNKINLLRSDSRRFYRNQNDHVSQERETYDRGNFTRSERYREDDKRYRVQEEDTHRQKSDLGSSERRRVGRPRAVEPEVTKRKRGRPPLKENTNMSEVTPNGSCSRDGSVSRYGRKRKIPSNFEVENLSSLKKRKKVEESRSRVIQTPVDRRMRNMSSGMKTLITKDQWASSSLATPKSSKTSRTSKLKNRRKTPIPHKSRRLTEDLDDSYYNETNNSDIR